MNHPFSISTIRLIAAAALSLAAPLSMAGGHPDVSWSLSVGSSHPAPRVYAPPPPVVYVQPQPVYVRPRPVYVQPVTVVQHGPYYVEEVRYKKVKRHHWKHHGRHHGHDDDDDRRHHYRHYNY